jgi:hypothetical protein
MQNADMVVKLKELKKEVGGKALIRLEDGSFGGWFVEDVRRVRSAEIREMGLPSETLAVALVIADSEREMLTLNALVKKLSKQANIAGVYAEIGLADNPLLPVITIRAETTSGRCVIIVCCAVERTK